MDITQEVNDLITGGTTNNGYGLAFDCQLEKTITALHNMWDSLHDIPKHIMNLFKRLYIITQ